MKTKVFGGATVALALCANFTAFGAESSEQRGEDLFRVECMPCHSMGCNRRGPGLAGFIGRKAGSVADFPGYSDGLKNANWNWTEERLDRWIKEASKMVPGNYMSNEFGGIEDAEERRLIIRYVKQGDTSLDLCGGSR